MKEHKKECCFNQGKTSVHCVFQVRTLQRLSTKLTLWVMIGLIACQSNSLRRVNWLDHCSSLLWWHVDWHEDRTTCQSLT